MTGINALLALPTLALACILYSVLTLRKQAKYGIVYYYSDLAATDRIFAMVLFGLGQAVLAVVINRLAGQSVQKWLLFAVLSFIVTLVALKILFTVYSAKKIPHPGEAYPREGWE